METHQKAVKENLPSKTQDKRKRPTFGKKMPKLCQKNTYPSVDLITLQVTHILLENLEVEHISETSPQSLNPFYHLRLKSHRQFYWLKLTLDKNDRKKDKKEYCLFSGKADKKKSHEPIQNSSILPLFSIAEKSNCCQLTSSLLLQPFRGKVCLTEANVTRKWGLGGEVHSLVICKARCSRVEQVQKSF